MQQRLKLWIKFAIILHTDKKQKDLHYVITRVSHWGLVIGYRTQIL